MKTRICELLNIDYPILQGGMAWVATAELAVAVSEAGGLEPVQATCPLTSGRDRKGQETDHRTFGVNLMLHHLHR